MAFEQSWLHEELHIARNFKPWMSKGLVLGTIMTGNVWMVIVPSQRSLVAATRDGKEQDAVLSKRSKERSIHNNYLTFPLLFIMLSNHFSSTWGHSLRWVILVVVMLLRPEGLIPSRRRAAEFREGVHDQPLYDLAGPES